MHLPELVDVQWRSEDCVHQLFRRAGVEQRTVEDALKDIGDTVKYQPLESCELLGRTYFTPRRFAIRIDHLAQRQDAGIPRN